jgi:hypothetical protein
VYYIAEVTTCGRKVVDVDDEFKYAEKKAIKHSGRSGLAVDILDELFRPLKQVYEWREEG